MGWKTIGTVKHTDSGGNIWERRVVRDDATGDTERSFGTRQDMSHDTSSRSVGHTRSDDDALTKSQGDLQSTFKK